MDDLTPAHIEALGLEAPATATLLEPYLHGGLRLTADRGERKRQPPRALAGRYDAVIFALTLPASEAEAETGVTVRMLWAGNAYGEIRDAHAAADPDHAAFERTRLGLDVRMIGTVPNLGDPRAWPMRFAYAGRLSTTRFGSCVFGGTFDVDAFGSYRPVDRTVRGLPERLSTILAAGPRIDAPVPPLPFDAFARNAGAWVRYDAS